MDSTAIDLTRLIARLQEYLGEFRILVYAAAFAAGAAMIIAGVAAAARRADQGPGQGGWAGPIALMIAGFGLAALPAAVNSLAASIIPGQWSDATIEIFSTAPTLLSAFDGAAARDTIVGILRIVQFIGILAIFRGILILNASAQPSRTATAGAGITHLAGGALAVNIGPVLGMLESLVAP